MKEETMFFREPVNIYEGETAISNIFFEQILPVVDPIYLKIYLFAYYKSCYPETQNFTNEDIMRALGVSKDELLQAWDFFEKCNLIIKHRIENGRAGEFSVEFKDIRKNFSISGKKAFSPERLLLNKQREDYKLMYAKIEDIIGTILLSNQCMTINDMIVEYNLSKDLVVEAFRFLYEKQGSRSVNGALKILRTWALEGVKTVEDVKNFKSITDKRYGLYRKILSLLGEFRNPSDPEIKMMNVWLDDYGFAFSVIEEAINKTIIIRKPTLIYVDGILKRWHEETENLNLKPKKQKDPTIFRVKLLDAIHYGKKAYSTEDAEDIEFLYQNCNFEDILLAIKYIKDNKANLNLHSIRELFENNKISTKIEKEEIKEIIDAPKIDNNNENEKELEQMLYNLSREDGTL